MQIHTNHFIKYLFLVVTFLATIESFAQLSKTHYIPPLTSAESGNANPEEQYFYISTPNGTDIPYTIKPIGQSATNYITGTVSNTNPREIYIGTGNVQLFIAASQTNRVVNNKGYIIEAEDLIYVSVRMRAGGGAQAGALVSKGLSALGTTFRIGSFTNENPQSNYLSFVSVMATEDNTQVTFDNSIPTGLDMAGNLTAAFPLNTTLNEGESYTIAVNSAQNNEVINRDGLIGTLVTSNNPIVVNCGSANGSFHNGNSRDYGIDQIAGLSKVGTEYIFVKGGGNNDWENVLIVPHTTGTTLSINGGAPITITGRYYLIEGNQYSAVGNMYVETSEPVFAYQGTGSSSEANQGMFFVPPLSCEARGNIDNIANIDNIGNVSYSGVVSIVTKVGATVTVNNLPLTSFSTTGPSTVTGNTDYVTYKITNLANNVSVQGDDELYVGYYNVNGVATSGSFYSGFPSSPEINFDTQLVTLGNCIPNVTLSAANTQNFDSFEWWFDDGSGFINTNINTPDLTPTIPGKYKLIGIITCSGLTLESVEVPVSICPDDIDNDGIIDNIDIDNDNDGILNCTESRGDVTINLLNLTTPQLVFQDNSTNSVITSGVFTETSSSGNTNSLSGTSIGQFTSIVQPANSAENDYSLSFAEPVNVKFTEDTSITHTTTDGEFFIAKIIPANKNITLVDPDGRLLVDSNFDGIFETGVNQISGSEIHFKVNPTPNGAIPYEFFANQVDGFTFKHILSNINDASNFQGIISLTCFKKDTDLDGVKDELDLDSDNDGIPDFIENDGVFLVATGLDDDSDGLDDAYDPPMEPIDSDGDGVYDFYDLDSDNDGIYDINEADPFFSSLSDTGTLGIDDGPVFGVNGWTDRAETAPDSNLIGYTLDDTDSDGIFSYLDLDSDGDGCSDVIEAGFSDINNNNLLGNTPTPADVDANGKVTGAGAVDGYTVLLNNNFITASPITIIAHPPDIESCELSTTIISISSSTYDTIQWEVSTDGGLNWNTIVNDATYSGSQTADLTISNTPLSFDTYEYRAFLELAGNSCGLYSDLGELTVILLPVANTASNMPSCDNDNNGTMPFDLESQNNGITTIPNMTITYHVSQADADNDANPLTSPFESGNTTIYARVENDINTTCYDTSTFNLEIYESAFPLDALSISPIQECDNTSIGTDIDGFIVFDLTQKETEILNGQSATDFTLTYFSDSGYINQIITPNSFTNAIAGGQTIYVRMTNNLFNTCYTDTAFNIEVFELPIVNNPTIYSQCDDNSNDGQATFNLTLDSIKAEINPNYITDGLTFTYFETQLEAETNGNPIVNPNSYTDALGFANETVWVRTENPNDCFRVVPLTLEVNPSSAALALYNPTSLYQCDDGVDVRDGVSSFNLTNIHDHISTVIFSTFNVTIHFYESELDAQLETNEILDIANHQNTNSPILQDIWVRVKSDLGNNCLGLEELPNLLIVEPLPLANPVSIARQCDFDVTDTIITYPFDTSQIETNLLNGQTLLDVTVEYTYLDSNGVTTIVSNTLPNPFITASQTVSIRVTNNVTADPDGACYDETTLEFIVDNQPIAYPIAPQMFCDDGSDDSDGIHDFDVSLIHNTLLNGQSGMEVHYYNENGVELSSPLPNPFTSGTQTLLAEVINPINNICYDSTDIELIVNPLPEFTIETPQIVCSSDPTFTIVLDPIEANITENFNYEWLYQDGTFLSNAATLTVSIPGTYSVTLTNPVTNCTRTRDVFVNASELATITLDDITIVDISETNSVTINPVNLGLGDYEYALKETDEFFIVYQDKPFFDNVKAGFYTLFIRDKNGCGTTSIDISVIGYPKFFTPNNDGNNDFWQIKGVNAQFQPNSSIHIFDRYGKLLKQINPTSTGWDGTYNGEFLNTDDYWFKVLLQDGRQFMGHFTLKR